MDFEAMWDAHPDLMLVVGAGGLIDYANRAAVTSGLQVGTSLPDVFSNVAASPFWAEHQDAVYHVNRQQLADRTVLVSAHDITEPRRAELEVRRQQAESVRERAALLREKSELLTSVLDQMGEGVIAADREGRILVWNSAATKILNLSPLAHVSEADEVEVYDIEGKLCEASLLRALRGDHVDEELLVRHPGIAEAVWMMVTARPLRDDSGALSGAVAVFRDSTVQRQLKDTLGHARDAALQATRLKSEFLANMSHEIRTPLNGIIGMGEMLAQSALDQAQREYVSTVRLCSQSLLSIVDNVLDFSKIEAGKAELSSEAFSLESIIEEALELAATGLGDKQVEMYARLQSGLPRYVLGDAHRVRQILLNYLSNALKFTAAGEVTVTVEKLEADTHFAKLRFVVSDTGTGVDPVAHPRLFQPFSQADSSSKRRHGGTGLGLVICRSLAEMMGGEAGLLQTRRPGSSFFFTARFGIRPDSGRQVSLQHLPPMALQLQSPGLQETVRTYLEACGARVIDSCEAGCRFLVCDHDTGHLSQPTADLRVIYLGGSRPTGAGGHVHFLRKPLKFSRLLSLLREVAGSVHDSGRRATLSLPLAARPLRGRVLVAEDNPINRRVLLLMLEKMGLEVSGAENGQQAAEAALSGDFNLVLMDCQMPVMDGHEATRLVRAQWAKPAHLPIVAVTANALEGEADRCRASGMDDYLSKPVTAEALRGVVERWLPLAGEGARASS